MAKEVDSCLRAASRKEWLVRAGDRKAYMDEIQAGALQRIADAAELMARDRAKMVEELEQTKRLATYWQDRSRRLDRRIAALRGVITRIKRRAH